MKKFNRLKFTLLSIIALTLILSLFTSCADDPNAPIAPPTHQENTYTGKLEKGAFQQGAEIIAYGWDTITGFTGESFATVTSDDLGNYTLKSTKIKDILYVKAEGYFFNENTGLISGSTLKLYGMVDSTKVPWNINVLTHIIQPRVVYLLEQSSDYDTSVNQAIAELFTNFNWTPIDPGTQSVANNAELLLLSAAICKGRTVSEISSLLTTLASDLEDGSIDVSMLDDSFYTLDVTEIETNMTNKYGSCPTLSGVKSALLTFRNITGPPPKIFTPDAIAGYDFYYMTATGNLKGLNSTTKAIDNISITCLITQSGQADRTVSVNFQSFYIKDNLIYYSALIDSEIKYVAQYNSTVTIMEQTDMPIKPTKIRVTLDHSDFKITTDFYDPYIVSDVKPVNAFAGAIRNIMVNDYFIGTNNTTYGIFYVVVDQDEIVRQSGLYFTPYNDARCNSVLVELGELWKF